jgi:hypothetical protein
LVIFVPDLTIFLVSIRSMAHLSGICRAGSVAVCQQAATEPVWHIPDAVCTVLDFWWWTERPSETCRVLFQNKINLRYCASGWFSCRSAYWIAKFGSNPPYVLGNWNDCFLNWPPRWLCSVLTSVPFAHTCASFVLLWLKYIYMRSVSAFSLDGIRVKLPVILWAISWNLIVTTRQAMYV